MTAGEGQADHYKMLGEWALAAGRSLQSKQTGFAHYYYGEAQPPYDSIPLVENALFALALFRTRLMEQVQEAKALLTGLVGFQNLSANEELGNFPVYLHEYPQCSDSTLSLQLLPPFYWILRHFGNVLGVQLKNRLEEAARLALAHSLAAHRQKVFPYSIAVRLAGAQYAYGTLWKIPAWEQEGRGQLEELAKRQLDGWTSTKHLGELLLGLQMAYPSLPETIWRPLWDRMEETWHFQTGSYQGPCIREWQEREEPQASLFDLFGGYFSGQFSRRATLLRPYHLYGAVLQQTQDRFHLNPPPSIVKGHFKQQNWKNTTLPSLSYTLLEKKEPYNPSVDKTFTPFRLIWGDLHRTHSFVCQGGCYDQVEFSDDGSAVQLIFDLREELPGEGIKQKREIEFFVDFHPGVQFSLGGLSSSTFELGHEMKIELGGHQLSLVFDLLDGEGAFLGHVMKGNRPSQIDLKGENRFQAYDWTIFLRTIRRQGKCRLRASLTFLSPS